MESGSLTQRWVSDLLFYLQVCLAAVGLVGDLCRALQSNILPFCDEVMQLLLENLGVSVYLLISG